MAEALISWVAPVTPDRLDDLRRVLCTIGKDPGENPFLPFARLPMLHFASLVLFDEGPHAAQPILVFESNIDPPYRDYASAVVRIGRRGLDDIFSCCARYPGQKAADGAIVKYLARRKRKACLFHIGHPNRSVQEIKGDYELRRSIWAALEKDPALKTLAPLKLLDRLRGLANCPNPLWPLLRPWHPSWRHEPVGPPTPLDEIEWLRDYWPWGRLGRFVQLAAIGLAAGVAIVTGLEQYLGAPRVVTSFLLSVVAFLALHYSSPDARILSGAIAAFVLWGLLLAAFRVPLIAEPGPWIMYGVVLVLTLIALVVFSSLDIVRRLALTRPFPPPDEPRLQRLLAAEDRPEHSIYNHVAGLSVLKGRFLLARHLRTRLALFLLNLFYRTQFVKGKLLTIPSIHFAQWSLVGGRYLLFVTNYDGGADSYLDDFFNSLAKGVALIWDDTTDFPSTTDPRRLKVWVRCGQTLASVRYRAAVYDGLTVADINNNTYIRKRLLRGQGQASARRWVQRLSGIPVEPSVFSRFIVWLAERLRLRN